MHIDYLCCMSNININSLKEGDAIVDLKFNEVFAYARSCDAAFMEQRPDKFRLATEEEAKNLADSGLTCISLS